jgi:predicted short-subunit dehydrogenase-like oxidoreductase (DUF2520 family)
MPWKIGLIGTGNLAAFWAREIIKHRETVVFVKGSNNEKTIAFGSQHACAALEENSDVDLYLIAVQNDAIDQVIAELPTHRPVFVCAGFHRSNLPHVGYLYPLQSIHVNRMPRIEEVPFLIDAREELGKLGEKFLSSIGATFHHVTTEERLHSHLAAVFINNFGYFILKEGLALGNKVLPTEMFLPLLHKTVENALSEEDLQTGPARRNDRLMMEEQLRMLDTIDASMADLYRHISQLIVQKYHEL